jgi:hypothetical protein
MLLIVIGMGLVSLDSMLTNHASFGTESAGPSKVTAMILLACGLVAMALGFRGWWRVRRAHSESTGVGSVKPSSKPALDWRKDERISREMRRCEIAWTALLGLNFTTLLDGLFGVQLWPKTLGVIVGFAIAQVILVTLVLVFRAQRRKAYEALG